MVQLVVKSFGWWDELRRSTVAPGWRWAVIPLQSVGDPDLSPEAEPWLCWKRFRGCQEPAPAWAWGWGWTAVSGGGFLSSPAWKRLSETAEFGGWPSAPQVHHLKSLSSVVPLLSSLSRTKGAGECPLHALSLALGALRGPSCTKVPSWLGMGCELESSVFRGCCCSPCRRFEGRDHVSSQFEEQGNLP